MERQGKGMDLFHSGVTLVMSNVEGLEALSQATNARCMGSALTLSDNAMRSVLPKYCGYEVCIPCLQSKVLLCLLYSLTEHAMLASNAGKALLNVKPKQFLEWQHASECAAASACCGQVTNCIHVSCVAEQ